MAILSSQQSRILQLLRYEGRLSRRQLHQRLNLRPNTVGKHVAELLEAGFVQEEAAEAQGPGRPRVPVSVDPNRLNVVGVAIRPGMVDACRLNLLGRPLGRPESEAVGQVGQTIATLGQLLGRLVNDQTCVVGLSTTGFVDPAERRILLSSALPGQQAVSLDPVLELLGERPVVIDNDMRALAARWMYEHHQESEEDVLLVYLDDGALGSALLVRGRPNRGCLIGGNELGHTRFPVDTEDCYCGHQGCLERICSTAFLHGKGSGPATLLEQAMHYDGTQPIVDEMLDLLATGIANQVNFIRPHHVVLVSQYTRYPAFSESLTRRIRARVLLELAGRVQFSYWDQPVGGAGETAGWLGLATIYSPNSTGLNVLE